MILLHFKEVNIMTTITKNYTKEMEAKLMAEYKLNPTRQTVSDLAIDLGKSTRSITAKLCQLGIYKKIERVAKTGKLISKSDLVKIINEHYNLEMPSLVKATKNDLEKLVMNLED